MSSLKQFYLQKIIPNLIKEFKYKNLLEIPKLDKISIHTCLGINAQNKILLQKAIDDIRSISGQHPILTKAKQSVSAFKIREGMPLGLLVTLRKNKMYNFLEKLIELALPQIRDFQGISATSFDSKGNYNFGISDQLCFPELNNDSIDKRKGLNITIATTAKTDKESYFLLKELGIPFIKT